MFRTLLVLILTLQSVAQAAQQDDVTVALAHAEALYYDARFNESIQLLTRIDGLLAASPGSTPEKTKTKLRLALAHIGLNQQVEAKHFLMELFALDSDFALDPQQFPPKVIALVADAKAEQKKARCQGAMGEARKQLEMGNGPALLDLIGKSKAGCQELESLEPVAADLLFKTGVVAYKNGEFVAALGSFETALKLAPRHELASEYIELTQSKLQVANDRLLLQWQKDFDTHQFGQAAADFRQIASSRGGSVRALVDQMNTEYRNALTTLVEKWNRTCPVGDSASMDAIRSQVSELLPEPSFGSDLQDQMTPCPDPGAKRRAALDAAPAEKAPGPTAAGRLTPVATSSASGNAVSSVPTPAFSPAPSLPSPAEVAAVDKTPSPGSATPLPAPALKADCLQLTTQLALLRLKTRVDPEVPPSLQASVRNAQSAPISFRVKAKIDENGNVVAADAEGGSAPLNAAVRTAVQAWKFTPVRDQSGPRCVETEIPIVWKVR